MKKLGQRMPTFLAGEFQASASALQEAFPAKLDRLVVLTDGSLQPAFISPDVAARLRDSTSAVRRAVEYAFPPDKPMRAGLAINGYPMEESCNVDLIALKEDIPGMCSDGYIKEMLATFVFDHELGHLVVRNGMSYDEHLNECAADAYAALRHIQRFGKDTGFFESHSRAPHVVLGGSLPHYTDAALREVKALSARKDMTKLSLQETAKRAADIADRCSLGEATLGKLARAYLPVADACKRHIGDRPEVAKRLRHKNDEMWPLMFRETVRVMREYQGDSDIFQAGKSFLSHPDRRKYMEDLARTDPEWKAALDFIDMPEKEGNPAGRPSPQGAKAAL
ncbi:MAG: hypothetical protein KGQ70_08100 [Alphaproteobacteria bacterium]|nr:hypothetical protein [Alphaproteobacteria bacterium]